MMQKSVVTELLKELSLFALYVRSKHRNRECDESEQRHQQQDTFRHWVSTLGSADVGMLLKSFTASTYWTLTKDMLMVDLITSSSGIAHNKPLYLIFDPAVESMTLLNESGQQRWQAEYLSLERNTGDRQIHQADMDLIDCLCTSLKMDDQTGGDVSMDGEGRLQELLSVLSGGCCFLQPPVAFRQSAQMVTPWLLLSPRFTAGQFVANALEVILWRMWDARSTHTDTATHIDIHTDTHAATHINTHAAVRAENTAQRTAEHTNNCQYKLQRAVSAFPSLRIGLMGVARAAILEIMKSTDVEKLNYIFSATHKR